MINCLNYLQSSVSDWLDLLRLSEHNALLEHQGYTHIDSITDITWEDLEDIGITKLGKNFEQSLYRNFAILVFS